jgi:hypothetical protein
MERARKEMGPGMQANFENLSRPMLTEFYSMREVEQIAAQ